MRAPLVFLIGWIALMSCAGPLNGPAAIPSRETPPILSREIAGTQSVCPARPPLYSTLRDDAPILLNLPHAVITAQPGTPMVLASLDLNHSPAAIKPKSLAEMAPAIQRKSQTQADALGQIQLSAERGTIAYEVLQGPNPANNAIEIVSRETRTTWTVTPADGCAIMGFALDSAGRRLAEVQVALRGQFTPARWQVNIADLTTPEKSYTLTGGGESTLVPIGWSAADTIIYQAVVPFQAMGRRGIWQGHADGSGLSALLNESDFVGEPKLSPDGKQLAYLASDPERLPKMELTGAGEPPANQITVLDLTTGERRPVATTTQGFGHLAWVGSQVVFTEGTWAENQFQYNRVRSANVETGSSDIVFQVGSDESIDDIEECRGDSVLYASHSSTLSTVRWWKDGNIVTLASTTGVGYHVWGCME